MSSLPSLFFSFFHYECNMLVGGGFLDHFSERGVDWTGLDWGAVGVGRNGFAQAVEVLVLYFIG